MDEFGRWLLAVTLLGGGAVISMIGRKQRDGTLGRNRLAGLRTEETLASDEAWRAAHDATARPIVAAGVVSFLGGVLVAVLGADEALLGPTAIGTTVVTLAIVVAAGIRGHRIAARVNRDHGIRSDDGA